MKALRALMSLLYLDRHCIRRADIRLYSRHPILNDLAVMLSASEFYLPVGRAASVMLGTHSFHRRILPSGLRIGLQTEQIFDYAKQPLWAAGLANTARGAL